MLELNTQHDTGHLDHDISGVALEFRSTGGAGDDHQAEGGGNQAQQKQYPVAFFGEILQLLQESAHRTASFLKNDYTISFSKSK